MMTEITGLAKGTWVTEAGAWATDVTAVLKDNHRYEKT